MAALYLFTDAAYSILAFLIVSWSGVFLAGALLLALLVFLLRRRGLCAEASHPPLLAGSLRQLLLACGGLVVVVVICGTGVGQWARFVASQAALEELAESVRNGKSLKTPAWVGLYRVEGIERLDGSIRVTTCDAFYGEKAGVCWWPESFPPPTKGEDVFAPLGGEWWTWRGSF